MVRLYPSNFPSFSITVRLYPPPSFPSFQSWFDYTPLPPFLLNHGSTIPHPFLPSQSWFDYTPPFPSFSIMVRLYPPPFFSFSITVRLYPTLSFLLNHYGSTIPPHTLSFLLNHDSTIPHLFLPSQSSWFDYPPPTFLPSQSCTSYTIC